MEVQPPFLRPHLTEAQLEAKVLDNGIQNDQHSNRVSVYLILVVQLLQNLDGICTDLLKILGGSPVFWLIPFELKPKTTVLHFLVATV